MSRLGDRGPALATDRGRGAGAGPAKRFNVDDLIAPVREANLRRLPRLVWGSLRLVWSAARGEMLLTVGVKGLASVGLAAQVVVGRRLLSGFVQLGHGAKATSVVPSLVALAGATAVVALAGSAATELQKMLSELVARHSVGRVLDVAVAADPLAFETPAFHDRLQRAQMSASYRPTQMTTGLINLVGSLFGVASLAAALLFIQPLFLALVVAAYVPVWAATTNASRAYYRSYVELVADDRRRHYLQDVLTGKALAGEVRSFGLGGFFRQRWEHLYDRRVARLREVMRKRLAVQLAGGVIMAAMMAGTVGLLVWMVSSHRLSLAGAGAAVAALVLLSTQLQGIASGAGQLFESALFVEDFSSFVQSVPLMARASPAGLPSPPERFGVLRAEDITFTYPSRHEPSLHEVTVEIRSGEVVALVGENGSGKTTLAKVLAGLYRPDAGRLTWDGADATGFDPGAWRRRVAVVFQDYARYFLSAGENIGVGDWRSLDDRGGIEAAARRAGAHDIIDGLDEGYDTLLGPQFFGGVELSGGEWQRIALARAFFRDASLVVLDEPTAALDPRSEAALFASIRELVEGRSTLLISHRFSSVRSADRIYVLQGGVVVESGTHQELMALGGTYAELFSTQAAAYVDVSRRETV